ncbi:uncharacterized protein METZ01_LOCUS199494 [marine metagenome]|uniref:Uncharacterized protein n=1 Tax=marine metagenome TaxID=408172 RepID=A0A382E7L9_9ZZZZ
METELEKIQQNVIERQLAYQRKLEKALKIADDCSQSLKKIVDLQDEYYKKRIYVRDWTVGLN